MNENYSPNMTPERWHQAGEIYADALERSAGEARDAFVANACGDDHALLQQVRSLLAEESRAYDVLSVTQVQGALGAASKRDADNADIDDITHWYGKRFGAYRITEEIARGGMGSVFKAVRDDDQYHKEVAIKIIRPGMDTRLVVARFKAERQILASLDHPNIARLIDGGTTEDGVPFFVMDYVDGQSIDDYCKNKNTTLIERLQLFRTVCSAVHFAHQRLVVHRDLKPSNILVDTTGQVKLLDFGIAKLLDPTTIGEDGKASAAPTVANAMTPAYASPEQIKGEAITTASDVYALGVVLYRLLTGRSPYKANNTQPLALAKEIVETDPEKPSTVVTKGATSGDTDVQTGNSTSPAIDTENVHKGLRSLDRKRLQRNLSGDLDNIVLMALRKDPTRRYASAEQLSEDVKRYLEDMPVAARADTFSYRTVKFVTRNKWAVAFASVAFVGLLGGITATTHQTNVAHEQTNVAQAALTKAEAERTRAQRNFETARKFSNETISTVLRELVGVNSTRPLQQKLIAASVKQLEELSSNTGDDPTLLSELGKGYASLARTQGKFGDVPQEQVQSNRNKAEVLLNKARILAPLDVDIVSNFLSFAATYDSEIDGALVAKEKLLEAISVGRTLEDAGVRLPRFQFLMANTILSAGDSSPKCPLSECLPLLQEATLRLESLLASDEALKQRVGVHFQLCLAYFQTGSALSNSKLDVDRVLALTYFTRAIESTDRFVALYPENSRAQSILATYRMGRATYLLELKRNEEAAADLIAARPLVTSQRIANNDELDTVISTYMLETLDAEVELSRLNIIGAEAKLNQAAKIREEMTESGRQNIESRILHAWGLALRADLEVKIAENSTLSKENRKARYRKAIANFESAADWFTKNDELLTPFQVSRALRLRSAAIKGKNALARLN
jgi:eukaryotic-like serine/threonine-protein kinase